MSLSIQKMVSDGALSTIVLGVQYLQRNDMYMRIAGVETPQSGAPSGYTWSFLDNNTIRVLPVVPAGVEVVVYRRTDLDAMYNIYSQNAQFDESTIDENNQQLLYIAQEYFEQGVPAQLIESVEYVREDTVNMYYRLKLSDGKYTTEFPVPKGGAAGFEALRRSYAEAGFTLVDGSFEDGDTLTSASDVLLHKVSGIAYSWGGTLPITVAPNSTPTPLGSGGWIDRSDVTLHSELAGESGSTIVNHGVGSVGDIFDAARPLSYYGNDHTALLSLLNYAKSTGRPIRLTSDVSVTEVIDIDFNGAKLVMYFNGNSILSDSECIVLRNLAPESEIHEPNIRNVATPWVITRWDSSGNWISPVLSQSNAPIGYMPTVNDNDIWSTLTSEQQNQSISPRMRLVSSDGVTLFEPKGRFALYQFDDCNYCEVQNPDIESGGKGQFGTILFNNIQTSAYGLGNKVVGGKIGYGSFSSVCFMRNKRGGVSGGFVPYRSGESGIKTYQGEVSGRSARCYSMAIDDVSPFQTVYDGIDMLSDYGDTPVERVDDHPLSSYAWHELPTKHDIKNVTSIGCRGVGIWGDGSLNEYTNIRAEDCVKSGIKNLGVRQFFRGVTAINCNRANTLTGEHQIAISSGGNSISTVRVIVEASTGLTNGYSLYAPNSYVKDIDVSLVENSSIASVFSKGLLLSDRSSVLASSGDSPRLALMGRLGQLANPIGYFGADVTLGASGNESGDAIISGVDGGVAVHGVKATGNYGGSVQLAVANSSSASTGATLGNNEILFYNDSGVLRIAFKNQAGAVGILTP